MTKNAFDLFTALSAGIAGVTRLGDLASSIGGLRGITSGTTLGAPATKAYEPNIVGTLGAAATVGSLGAPATKAYEPNIVGTLGAASSSIVSTHGALSTAKAYEPRIKSLGAAALADKTGAREQPTEPEADDQQRAATPQKLPVASGSCLRCPFCSSPLPVTKLEVSLTPQHEALVDGAVAPVCGECLARTETDPNYPSRALEMLYGRPTLGLVRGEGRGDLKPAARHKLRLIVKPNERREGPA